MLKTLKLYRSPRGWAVVPIHYTHDPAKASIEWATAERAKYPDAGVWARDMEMDFAAHVGAACYSAFRPTHLVEGLEADPAIPLDLCMDFNFYPMLWIVTQVVNGWECAIEQIRQAPASVERMVKDFRNRYPAHRAGLRIYGDATGKGSDGHVGASYYQLVELEFRGYPAPVEFRVPRENPKQLDRVAAVNRRLQGADGAPSARIDPIKCPDLVADLQEVVWHEDGKRIFKVNDQQNPYALRTHASDAWGYKIAREWPVIAEVLQMKRRAPVKVPPRRLMGMVAR